jgi:hypothetical protein
MTHEPFFAYTAVEAARRQVNRARPDAPVVPDPAPRTARVAAARFRLAGSLRSVARWVEPRPAKVCQPG